MDGDSFLGTCTEASIVCHMLNLLLSAIFRLVDCWPLALKHCFSLPFLTQRSGLLTKDVMVIKVLHYYYCHYYYAFTNYTFKCYFKLLQLKNRRGEDSA